MVLVPEQSIALDAYSLFCRFMVDRLDSLRLACSDGKLDLKTCVEEFDDCFRTLFKKQFSDRCEALNLVARNLETAVLNVRVSNADAAKVIAEAREEALDNAGSWSYAKAIEMCHEQGRDLAVLFFEKSPWNETKRRLHLRAKLNYQWGRARAAQTYARLSQYPASPKLDELKELALDNERREAKAMYKGLPGALYTFEGRKGGDYSINVPLTADNGVMLYASYPFLFMHEYTAHIFARDYLNDRFNDGWMLYAASQYLVENWGHELADPRFSVLNEPQAYAFRDYLFGTLLGESQGHCELAQKFYDFLYPWDRTRFESISYELAAYEPKGRECDKWPGMALQALARDAIKQRGDLRQRLAAAPRRNALDALYPGLKLKLPTIGSV
jgi:hypothetical protein